MDKKPLIGISILAVVFLCLMPMISAVESKTTQESNIIESEKIFMNGVNNLSIKGVLFRIQHPILYSIVKWHIGFRADRGDFLMGISTSPDGMYTTHPILYHRGYWLFSTADSMCDFWNAVSVIWQWPYLSVYDWSS